MQLSLDGWQNGKRKKDELKEDIHQNMIDEKKKKKKNIG